MISPIKAATGTVFHGSSAPAAGVGESLLAGAMIA